MPQTYPGFRRWLLCLLSCSALQISYANEGVAVTVESPQQESLAETLHLSGSVTALQQASLSARVDGLVGEILVDAGATVAKGDNLMKQDAVLANLEHRQAQAAQTEAAASRDEAQRLLNEAERLRKNNHLSENEVRTRRANLTLANAALDAARARANFTGEVVQRHNLPAPFSGVVSRRLVDAGEWLNRGDPAFELVSLDQLVVDVNLPQERYRTLGPQTAVRICPDTTPGECVDGSIAAMIPVSDASARAFRLRLTATGNSAPLLPGTSATVTLELAAGNTQLLISRDALLRHPDGGNSVFVVKDNTAQRRNVVVAGEARGKVAIRDGITLDDQVIVRGNELLRDGQLIQVKAPATDNTPDATTDQGAR